VPSQQKRVALTLPDHVQEAIQALSEATGKPVATVIRELLEEMVPQLLAAAKFQRHVKAGNVSAAKDALRDMVGEGMAEIIKDNQPELFKPVRKARK
jgi:predicted DNA-binding protein